MVPCKSYPFYHSGVPSSLAPSLLKAHQKLTIWADIQPEFAHPYDILSSHSEIDVSSIKGGAAPLDPSSIDASKDDAASVSFLKSKETLWKNTEKIEKFLGRAQEYDALFFCGGHGRK